MVSLGNMDDSKICLLLISCVFRTLYQNISQLCRVEGPELHNHRSDKQFVSIIASSSPTKVTLECSDDTFPFSNIWEGKDTKYRHTGNNKSASYKYRTKTTSSNILKPTPSNHEGLREGTLKYKYILPQKGGQKASTLEGESAINPVSYQVEQIAPPPQEKVQ